METTSTLLTWIIFTPALLGVLTLLAPSSLEGKLRQFALYQTIINAILATFMYAGFVGGEDSYQFVHSLEWLPDWGINYFVGIDGISLPLVMLTAYVAPLAILGTWPDLLTGAN